MRIGAQTAENRGGIVQTGGQKQTGNMNCKAVSASPKAVSAAICIAAALQISDLQIPSQPRTLQSAMSTKYRPIAIQAPAKTYGAAGPAQRCIAIAKIPATKSATAAQIKPPQPPP